MYSNKTNNSQKNLFLQKLLQPLHKYPISHPIGMYLFDCFFKDRLETDFAQTRFQTTSIHFGRHSKTP